MRWHQNWMNVESSLNAFPTIIFCCCVCSDSITFSAHDNDNISLIPLICFKHSTNESTVISISLIMHRSVTIMSVFMTTTNTLITTRHHRHHYHHINRHHRHHYHHINNNFHHMHNTSIVTSITTTTSLLI